MDTSRRALGAKKRFANTTEDQLASSKVYVAHLGAH